MRRDKVWRLGGPGGACHSRGMIRMLLRQMAPAALLAATAVPAAAQAPQPRTLTVTPTAAWGHAETGMILPPRASLGGLWPARE